MSAPVPSALKIQALGLQIGGATILKDVELDVAAGSLVGVIGPNGAGKTTLLLMLASLLEPDAGELRVAGVDPVVDPRAARAAVGWMPDTLGAWPSLTARETLRLTARLYDRSAEEAADRAEHLLALVELRELADQPARVLSRGQKQRLGLARALVHDPHVLLLDEPASGLDPQARARLRELLRGFAAEGRTVLLSSHILSELEEVVDDAVFLVAGRTVAAAPDARSAEWRIRVAGAPLRVEEAAVALGVDAGRLRVDRGDLLVPFADDDAAADGLRALVGAGIRVVSFAPALGSLERAFLDLEHPAPPPPDASSTAKHAADENGAAS